MENYLKNLATSIWNGIYSIANGMSTMNIYPIKKIRIPFYREDLKKDVEGIKSDWANVGEDLRKARGYFSKKNNLNARL